MQCHFRTKKRFAQGLLFIQLILLLFLLYSCKAGYVQKVYKYKDLAMDQVAVVTEGYNTCIIHIDDTPKEDGCHSDFAVLPGKHKLWLVACGSKQVKIPVAVEFNAEARHAYRAYLSLPEIDYAAFERYMRRSSPVASPVGSFGLWRHINYPRRISILDLNTQKELTWRW